jgi:hypothetical protein
MPLPDLSVVWNCLRVRLDPDAPDEPSGGAIDHGWCTGDFVQPATIFCGNCRNTDPATVVSGNAVSFDWPSRVAPIFRLDLPAKKDSVVDDRALSASEAMLFFSTRIL